MLTLHGDRDRAVPISQAKALDQAMQAAGASHTLRVFEDQEHGFGGAFRRRELDARGDLGVPAGAFESSCVERLRYDHLRVEASGLVRLCIGCARVSHCRQ